MYFSKLHFSYYCSAPFFLCLLIITITLLLLLLLIVVKLPCQSLFQVLVLHVNLGSVFGLLAAEFEVVAGRAHLCGWTSLWTLSTGWLLRART